MRWLGSRLRVDPGAILLVLLTPSIVYLLTWNRITSYHPIGLVGFEKIAPCNLSRDELSPIISKFSSNSALLFSKLSEVQLKAFSETL